MIDLPKPLRTSQRLKPFFTFSRSSGYLPDHYNHMFLEDIHIGVMPLLGWPEGKDFRVDLSPPSESVSALIASALESELGGGSSLDEAISHFVESTAELLACRGRAVYEVAYDYNENNVASSFRIVRIDDRCVKNAGLFCWQLMPRTNARSLEERSARGGWAFRRFTWVPRKQMLVIHAPSALGGRRGMLRIAHNLSLASRGIMNDLILDTLKSPNAISGYDFRYHCNRTEVLVARTTRRLGWPMRGSTNTTTSEFYRLYRHVRFERTKAILRDHIVGALNDALRRIGLVLGFNATLALAGVRTVAECEDVLQGMNTGKLPIDSAWKWLNDRSAIGSAENRDKQRPAP